jgi:molybdopterin converting factor small subunit
MKVKITYLGRSYDVADGLPELLDLPAAARLDEALAALTQCLPDSRGLPNSCLVVLSGKHLGTLAHHENPALADEDELVLIAPVAGG